MKNFHQLTVEPGRKRRWKKSERKHRQGKPTGRGFRHTGDEVEEDMNTLKVKLHGARYGINEVQIARFGPVKRWLKSHVGQPWDKLWSEITKMEGKEFDRYHMRRHFKGFVHFENKPGRESKYIAFFGSPFKVGADGILRENIYPKQPAQEKSPTGEIPDLSNPMAVYFRTEKGLWFHIIRKPAQRYISTKNAKGEWTGGKWVEMKKELVTVSKRQVSTKMVKQLDLEKRFWS